MLKRSRSEYGKLRLLWVDDFSRPPSSDWIWATNYDQAVSILKSQPIEVVSLDHNLNPAHYYQDYSDKRTGYDIILYIEKMKSIPEVRSHAIDPNSWSRMARGLNKILQLRKAA